jgi:hypothetical protein
LFVSSTGKAGPMAECYRRLRCNVARKHDMLLKRYIRFTKLIGRIAVTGARLLASRQARRSSAAACVAGLSANGTVSGGA